MFHVEERLLENFLPPLIEIASAVISQSIFPDIPTLSLPLSRSLSGSSYQEATRGLLDISRGLITWWDRSFPLRDRGTAQARPRGGSSVRLSGPATAMTLTTMHSRRGAAAGRARGTRARAWR